MSNGLETDQTVCKGYQQITKVATSKERLERYPFIHHSNHSSLFLCILGLDGGGGICVLSIQFLSILNLYVLKKNRQKKSNSL